MSNAEGFAFLSNVFPSQRGRQIDGQIDEYRESERERHVK